MTLSNSIDFSAFIELSRARPMLAITFIGSLSATGRKSSERCKPVRASEAPTARNISAQGKRVIERSPGFRQERFPAARSVSASGTSSRPCRHDHHPDPAGGRDFFFIHPGLRRYRSLPWAEISRAVGAPDRRRCMTYVLRKMCYLSQIRNPRILANAPTSHHVGSFARTRKRQVLKWDHLCPDQTTLQSF
jgi:hypothetical protein